jgi:hypothetical protein
MVGGFVYVVYGDLDKCQVIHMGYNNPRVMYDMISQHLRMKEDKDLGVLMRKYLKCSQQCAPAVNKANRTLARLKSKTYGEGLKILS